MRRMVGFLVVSAVLIACSSDGTSTAPPCKIGGTYALTEKVDTTAVNTCGAKDDTAASTVTISDSGAITLQGVTGACPGTINGCVVTAACNGTAVGGGTSTIQISWTFDASGFKGSSALGLQPTGKPKCNTTFADTATRK